MPKKKNFESDIAELEQIAQKLESSDIPLDEAVSLFEKCMKLSAECKKILNDAEQKVKILIDSAEDTVETEDFDISEGT